MKSFTVDRVRRRGPVTITRHTRLHYDNNGQCIELKPVYYRAWYRIDSKGKCRTGKIEMK